MMQRNNFMAGASQYWRARGATNGVTVIANIGIATTAISAGRINTANISGVLIGSDRQLFRIAATVLRNINLLAVTGGTNIQT